MRKVIIHNHLGAQDEQRGDDINLYNRLDLIGGRAHLAGRSSIVAEVDRVKSLFYSDPVQFKQAAKAIINAAR